MEEKVGVPGCEHGTELMALLYSEATDAETHDLRRHMKTCSSCASEFANFTQIRHSISQWRQDSLGAVLLAPVNTTQLEAKRKKPSAIAAIRQFLDWSPVWLKGAVAFATLLFCLLAFLALAHLRTTDTPNLAVTGSHDTNDSPRETAGAGIFEQAPKQEAVVVPSLSDSQSSSRASKPSTAYDLKQVARARRRPLTKTEREQLAADLRLISPAEDADLELLGDRLTSQE